MEEYLENLKSLRSYMNDVEDEAAKRSAEEQSQKTAIGALDIDLKLVKSEIKKVNDETEEMIKEKNKVELEISEKQKKILSLEIECTTLKQTLELLHQEIGAISKKLNSKRSFYTNTTDNFSTGLKDHQEWIHKHKQLKHDDQFDQGSQTGEKEKKTKMEELEAKRSTVRSETLKNKELVEQEKCKIEALPLALRGLELNALETEYESLINDKSGEMEFVRSLQDRINALKVFCNAIECQCGAKYKVEIAQEG
ncbi:hypothetical protein LUZ60_008700 [Juncus effusus]|nr:hypothetical protein LUZ60_008700 [Juncus effusus]